MIHLELGLIGASTVRVIAQRVSVSWPWYVIRASGFVAAALLVLLAISGIGQVTGLIYRFIEPIKMWTIHKAIAIGLVISIAVHGGFLLVDHYLPFSLTQILVPFASRYSNGTKLLGIPLGGIAVTMGILATYLIVIIVLSSLRWIDTKKTIWRKTHYLSYVVFILVFLHALYTGSDLKYGLFRFGWIFLGLLILGAILIRRRRSGTINKT